MSSQQPLNIADRLAESARRWPDQRAVVFPHKTLKHHRVAWTHLTFRELENLSNALAHGFVDLGLKPGSRMVLMVRPSLEFIALTYALFKAGAVIVLIDPGMGPKNVFRCLGEVDPQGFVAISLVQFIRAIRRGKFPNAKMNVTVGRRLGWGGVTYDQLYLRGLKRAGDSPSSAAARPFQDVQPVEVNTNANDSAAIIFTSGSTGPPKGVLYEHGMFDAQVDLLQQQYQIQPGEIDLPGFPLFALFNAAMGVTTVIPDMDPTRPAAVDPPRILQAMRTQAVTQAFGSPAMWNRIGRYAEANQIQLPSLKRVLSAGAPVPVHVIRRIRDMLMDPTADIFTPYGATESLPVATIAGQTVLKETATLTSQGHGTCVGHVFEGVRVRVIKPVNGAIADIEKTVNCPPEEIGEIIVQAKSTTREYFRRPEPTQHAKIPDGQNFWHRMGDMGYFDTSQRLWFCGRRAHVVDTDHGPMYPVPCEAIFNEHPRIYRTALVGNGEKPQETPYIIAEPEEGQFPNNNAERQKLAEELLALGHKHERTQAIQTILFHKGFPVDVRHNIKINREALRDWADRQPASAKYQATQT